MREVILDDLIKTSAHHGDEAPRQWNCCEMLVSARNLEQHIKDYYLSNYRWTDSDKIEIINIFWIVANILSISILQ